MLERGEAYIFEYYANGMMTDALRAAGDFDIIHSHLSPAWLPLGALSPTPVVWTMHTNPHLDDDWALARYPQVHAVGITAEQMHAQSLKHDREFPIVYNGCDFDAYEPCYEGGEYLAFLGRMSPQKNPRDAIRIAKACDLPIVLAGQPQNADEQRYFAEEIMPLVDGDRVRWLGPVNHPQKNELLRGAAALLFPIQWDEPFGLVMIEAMACGTPVIAHRRGSVAEVVEEGVTGFSSGVIDGLADLVPQALALDRRQVRERARGRFGSERMVDQYVELYRKILGNA
jgi:glycosyltransferase involved in cell wall biosynthesis